MKIKYRLWTYFFSKKKNDIQWLFHILHNMHKIKTLFIVFYTFSSRNWNRFGEHVIIQRGETSDNIFAWAATDRDGQTAVMERSFLHQRKLNYYMNMHKFAPGPAQGPNAALERWPGEPGGPGGREESLRRAERETYNTHTHTHVRIYLGWRHVRCRKSLRKLIGYWVPPAGEH